MMKHLNFFSMASLHINKTHKPMTWIAVVALFIGLTACNDNSQTTPPPKKQSVAIEHGRSDSQVIQNLQHNLDKSNIDLTAISATPTAMNGIYWVMFEEAAPMFSDEKGEYLIQGQIVSLSGEHPVDITTALQSKLAKELLEKVDTSQMIIYPAMGERLASVYVFFDPTCHYCQKLHGQIKDINAKGIEVRYLAWPRSDKITPLTEAIWCSQDRKEALDRAKNGEKITAPACDNPVAQQLELGRRIGVSGTPAIFTESGVQIGGYLPADELAKLAIDYRQ
ncbi:DsbC family protein [Moraxella sp. Tifton1]|uniref:DsbC family protein n=1 Tax=Moraxella oculi TaxID=2940516 RepID=UPI002010FC81|nr:DsbC family protein [Moraxella sp. Tifton1]MCL1623570.1 DsbC family protein [Moraxella sp. Tifton1]